MHSKLPIDAPSASHPSAGCTPFNWAFREVVQPADVAAVRDLVSATGYFRPDEITVAAELVEERLRCGSSSTYSFVMADGLTQLAGYACFGPTPCTVSTFDLYWIAVRPEEQGCGLGRLLLTRTHASIVAAGGTRVYAETSGQSQYAPTRAFYERNGYRPAARLEDFYGPGDAKIIYEFITHPR